MINNMMNLNFRMMSLVGANTLSTIKANLLELIGTCALILLAAKMIPHLSGGKKIAAIGTLVFGLFMLAAIGDIDTLVTWVKKAFSWATGLQW